MFSYKNSMSLVVLFSVLSIWGAESSVLKPGTPAPSFSMPSMDGKREALRMWCGDKLIKPYVNDVPHTVIVSFWATYCKPCHKEIPELEKFYAKHKDEKLKIFLISIDDKGAGIVTPFAKEKKYSLPVLFDPYKKTAARYGVKSLPALFIIDPKGIIRYSSVGYKADLPFEETLEKVYTAIKNGEDVSTIDTVATEGDAVAVRKDSAQVATDDVTPQKTDPVKSEIVKKQITSKQKWHAVAQIECGYSPDSVAAQLQVTEDELKQWYKELKSAAINLWKKK